MLPGALVKLYVSQQKLRKLYILLVDSDLYVHKRVQQVLDETFSIHFACSAEEAWRSIEDKVPDIVLCEIELAGVSGLDLCRQIRSSATLHDLPIMLLTTLSTLQDKIAGFDAGADDYLVKPFDGPHLVARLRLLSRIKQMERQEPPYI